MPTLAPLFKALSDPSRLGIFERLTRGEMAVMELTAQFELSQPAVSQHLAVLRQAGLVTVRRDGRMVYYGVRPDAFRPLVDWLSHYQAFWPRRVDRLKALLERMEP